MKVHAGVHGPTPALHPFHGLHRWTAGQISDFCIAEALSPTMRNGPGNTL
jgi:hypothetical protein